MNQLPPQQEAQSNKSFYLFSTSLILPQIYHSNNVVSIPMLVVTAVSHFASALQYENRKKPASAPLLVPELDGSEVPRSEAYRYWLLGSRYLELPILS